MMTVSKPKGKKELQNNFKLFLRGCVCQGGIQSYSLAPQKDEMKPNDI